MKKSFFSVVASGCLLIAGAVVNLNAQSPDTTVRASIPFDFIVNGKQLPAGNYQLKRLGDEPTTMIVRNIDDSHAFAVFLTEPNTARTIPRRSELVFDHLGDSYFLSRIWDAGEQTGRLLPASRQERRMEREVASNGHTSDTVVVALN